MPNNAEFTQNFKTIEQVSSKTAMSDLQKVTQYILPETSLEVSISAFGSKINEFFEKIQKIENKNVKKTAKNGLNIVISKVVIELNSAEFANVIGVLDEFVKTDNKSFVSFFETAGIIKNNNLSVGSFIKVFSDLYDKNLQKSFVHNSNAIITADGSIELKSNVFNGFVRNIKQIINRKNGTKSEVRSFFQEIDTFNSLVKKQKIVDKFNEDK